MPVADRARRVRRALPERGRAAGGEQRRTRRDRRRSSATTPTQRPPAVQRPSDPLALDDRMRGWLEDALRERRARSAFRSRRRRRGRRGRREWPPSRPRPGVELDAQVGEVGDPRRRLLVSTETALGRQRPRPAAIVSSACSCGSVVRRRGPPRLRPARDSSPTCGAAPSEDESRRPRARRTERCVEARRRRRRRSRDRTQFCRRSRRTASASFRLRVENRGSV